MLEFDNVEAASEIDMYLRNLPPKVKAILTTRDSNTLKNTNLSVSTSYITVNAFDDKDSEAYLAHRLKDRTDSKQINKEDIKKLVKVVSNIPYKLEQVAAYLDKNRLYLLPKNLLLACHLHLNLI